MSENANMRIWDSLSKTDPKQTKGFKRAGGFSGTAIKPMWVWSRLTEKFGPVGSGWGFDDPTFQVVNGSNQEVLVYSTVRAWYEDNGKNYVSGVGGDKVVTYIKASEQYNRPERWENDDEAFKKAFTDALMNAFKFTGVAADVHMGMFDDNKYVREVTQEFEQARKVTDQKIAEGAPIAAQAKREMTWEDVQAKFDAATTIEGKGGLDERYDWFIANNKIPHAWKLQFDEAYEKRRDAIIEELAAQDMAR